MEYVIRKCAVSDLPALIELCYDHAQFEQTPYDRNGKLELLNEAVFSDSPKLNCYVIDSAEKLAGYFTFTFDFSTWDAQQFLHMDCLYLEAEFRGMKIGEKVFELLKAIAKENNCVNIQWQTPEFNTRAIGFYNRIGGMGKKKMRFFINT